MPSPPQKQERWPFPRAPRHEHNFPGRDAKPQEFALRMSCFPISRSLLTASCDGNGCGRTGKFTDQPCCSCQCSREGSSPSAGSTCSLPASPGSLECRCRMRARHGGCRGSDPSPQATSLDIGRMRLESSSWSQGTWIISLGQIPPSSASSGSCSCCFWRFPIKDSFLALLLAPFPLLTPGCRAIPHFSRTSKPCLTRLASSQLQTAGGGSSALTGRHRCPRRSQILN